ncbi:MAG TPA: pilin [Candidatus Nanoarchaeia archaeon]|nr:pilin [Candidatus Nanoarchaeia archaeon]
MKEKIFYLLLIFLISVNIALAESAPIDDEISPEDKAKFDQILEPIFKIYNFIKYIASVVAAIFLLYSGITYMTSGSDPKKRDQAKSTAAYVIIGLIIIWAAPLIVSLLI